MLDPEYPANLRTVVQRPPFLFVRGTLVPGDWRAVAVVGTRRPSAGAGPRTGALVRSLVEAGFTAVSGLARGIDTEVHRATLAAGGRTLAVLGSGIERMYPPENGALADRVAGSGALVSQFWPDAVPSRTTFPMRNVVSAGLALATVVVEAPATSGARLQARLALGQGRLVVLLAELLASEEWARGLARRDGVAVVDQPQDLVRLLERQGPPRRRAGPEQLRLL